MIHDNTCPHIAMQNLITTFGLSPSDFHLFTHLKYFLAGRRFHEDSEVKEAFAMCFA